VLNMPQSAYTCQGILKTFWEKMNNVIEERF
jgi:hypothetical protein